MFCTTNKAVVDKVVTVLPKQLMLALKKQDIRKKLGTAGHSVKKQVCPAKSGMNGNPSCESSTIILLLWIVDLYIIKSTVAF